MRDLSSYLNRRKIRTQEERNAWAVKNGIDSRIKLLQFCESNELKCSGTWVFSVSAPKHDPKQAEVNSSPPPGEVAAESSAEAKPDDSTWHTPAALRPLRKSAPLPKTSKSRKASNSRKPRSRKAKSPRSTEEPEE